MKGELFDEHYLLRHPGGGQSLEVMVVPDRKKKALGLYDPETNTTHVLAYFRGDEEIEAWDQFMYALSTHLYPEDLSYE